MNNVLTINERKFLREAYTHLSNDSRIELMESYIQEGIVSNLLRNISKSMLPKEYITLLINPHYGDVTKIYRSMLKNIRKLATHNSVIKNGIIDTQKKLKKYKDAQKAIKKLISERKSFDHYLSSMGNGSEYFQKEINEERNTFRTKVIMVFHDLGISESKLPTVERLTEIQNKYKNLEKETANEIVKAAQYLKDNVVKQKNLKSLANKFKNAFKTRGKIVSTITRSFTSIRSKISMMLSKRYRKATAAIGIGGALTVSAIPAGKAVGRQKAKQKAIIEKSRKYEKMAKQSIAKKDFRSAIRNHMNSLKVMIAGVISSLNVPISVKKAMRTTSGKAMAVAGSIAILAVGYFLIKIISEPLIALTMKIINSVVSAIKAGKAVATSLFQNAFRIAKKIIASFKHKFTRK